MNFSKLKFSRSNFLKILLPSSTMSKDSLRTSGTLVSWTSIKNKINRLWVFSLYFRYGFPLKKRNISLARSNFSFIVTFRKVFVATFLQTQTRVSSDKLCHCDWIEWSGEYFNQHKHNFILPQVSNANVGLESRDLIESDLLSKVQPFTTKGFSK